MTRYIVRRLLQAIPLLFIISLILFVLMRASGDPVATMGGRKNPRPEERERLSRLLGLDKGARKSSLPLAAKSPLDIRGTNRYR